MSTLRDYVDDVSRRELQPTPCPQCGTISGLLDPELVIAFVKDMAMDAHFGILMDAALNHKRVRARKGRGRI